MNEGDSMEIKISSENIRILIIEDEVALARSIKELIEPKGYQVEIALDSLEGMTKIEKMKPNLLLLDLALPPTDTIDEGMKIFKQCVDSEEDLKVIIITGEGTMDSALDCIRQGAEDFLIKPVDTRILEVIIERTLNKQALERKIKEFHERTFEKSHLGEIVGKSFLMQRVYKEVERAAQSELNVIVLGESGTGKGIAARAIHDESPRNLGPFVKVNCTALSEGVLESDLFGHEKGSFTGAYREKVGKFEYASGGTIFLDEIGDLSPAIQAKLLHAVEDKEIQRVGGNRTIRIDTRVITATNVDIKARMEEGRFRKDLYFRLNTLTIMMPPLRKRIDDIPLLADHFLMQFNLKGIRGFTDSAYAALINYNWPGNVRELRSVIQVAVINTPHNGTIGPAALTLENEDPYTVLDEPALSLKEQTQNYERIVIRRVLDRFGGKVAKAARVLGLTRSGLHKKIEKLKMEPDS